MVHSTWYTACNICVYTSTEQSGTLLSLHTSQKGLNEDAALGLQLAVKVPEHCPDDPQHNFEVC